MTAETTAESANNTVIPLMENGDAERQKPNASGTKRSFTETWRTLPVTYKFVAVLAAISTLLAAYLLLERFTEQRTPIQKITRALIPNPVRALPPSASKLHQFQHGAVCSDAEICSNIGSGMLTRSGNVVDAAIATLFCNGILTAQSLGIGGGFIMNIYLHSERKAFTLNAKEVAPLAAHKDMFTDPAQYAGGVQSIGVPGEVKGYWELHQKYGNLSWKELIEPSISMCDNGFIMSHHMYDTLADYLFKDERFNKTFVNARTGKKFQPGEKIYMHKELCDTYRMIAENGGNDFYNGTLADLIAEDLKDMGSIITKEDLQEYETRWDDSLSATLHDSILYVPPPPSGGVLTALILNILDGYNFTSDAIASEESRILAAHRTVEAFKYAFGYRTQLNDPHFENKTELINKLMSREFAEECRHQIFDNQTFTDPKHYGGDFNVITDKGTSHVSILAPNGDAISVTTSVNYYFGVGQTGKRTGIIFNTGLNDFAVPNMPNYFGLPPSPGNYIQPKKRAMSSMSPSILAHTSSGDVQLVIGAAGGTKIPTAITSVIARLLWFGENIKQAVDAPRFHHQLMPMEINYEYGNTQPFLDGLERLGHKTLRYEDRGSIICAIMRNETGVYANADFRKAGDVIGL